MKARYWIPVVVIVLAAVIVGYVGNAARKPTSSPGGVRQVDGVVLPEWAPKNPSPEFIRAAKVLKPIPPEMLEDGVRDKPWDEGTKRLLLQRYTLWWSSAWEFFGTLSDEQIEKYLSKKELRIPLSALTPKQRRAFDAFMDSWDKTFGKSAGEIASDIPVLLYKAGAKEDFSNVDVGFLTQGAMIGMRFWVRTPERTNQAWCEWFGII